MKIKIHYFFYIIFIDLMLILNINGFQCAVSSESIHIKNDNGIMLYVGGSGPENYSKIQDAINNATFGDTIYVYNDSSPYYENVIITKNDLRLIGEYKFDTIIDGSNTGHVIEINADNITFEGFTIRNSGSNEEFKFDSGIHIEYMSDFTMISNNIIGDNQHGIFIDGSRNSTISNNIILNNVEGIIIYGDAQHNIISKNKIEKNTNGIHEAFTRYSLIIQNDIINNKGTGIICSYTTYHITTKNNFINNLYHAYFEGRFKYFSERNQWIGNYWDNWIGFGPKLIKGYIFIPWINFDWFPANNPYVD